MSNQNNNTLPSSDEELNSELYLDNQKNLARQDFHKKLMNSNHAALALSEEKERKRKSRRKGKDKKKRRPSRNLILPSANVESKLDFDPTEAINQIRNMANLQDMNLEDGIISKIEGVLLAFGALLDCTNTRQAIAILLLWVKTNVDHSLYSVAKDAILAILEDKPDIVEPQNGTSSPPEWLQLLRRCSTDWKMFVNNHAFKKISTLISLLITLGLLSETSFKWDVKGIRLFSIGAFEKHLSAFDLIDAVMETVMYFVEGGYECFQQGSLRPLLYSDHRAQEFESKYFTLLGNLEHVKTGNLLKVACMSENDYDKMLHDALNTCQDLYRVAQGTWEKKIFSDRLLMLRKIKTTFDGIRVQGGLRMAPYCNMFYGKSGVGKSSISAITMVVGLFANGFRCDDDCLITLNEADKFMSNYRSYINGIFIDDIGNTKPDFVEKAPTNTVIEVVNNVRMYANMAEADMKGKVSVEPMFVNLTSNVKTLNAMTYSNEPVSIVRRCANIVTVKVKKEFCKKSFAGLLGRQLDPDKVSAYYAKLNDGDFTIPPICDIWELDVEIVVPEVREGHPDSIKYETVVYNGKPMINVDIYTYLDFVIEDSKKHFKNQRLIVASQNNLKDKIVFCKECLRPKPICTCTAELVDEIHNDVFVENFQDSLQSPIDFSGCEDVEPQFGLAAGYALNCIYRDRKKKYTTGLAALWEASSPTIENLVTKELISRIYELETSPYFCWTNWIPSDWLLHPNGKKLIMFAYKDEIAANVKSYLALILIFLFWGVITNFWLLTCGLPILASFTFFINIYLLYVYSTLVEVCKEKVYNEIVTRNDGVHELFKKHRDVSGKTIIKCLGAVVGLYLLFKIWKGFRTADALNEAQETQEAGNLDPQNEEDIKKRDAEVNPWVNYAITPVPYTHIQKVMTADEMCNAVFKQMHHMNIDEGDYYRNCACVYLSSNVLLMPIHMWWHSDRPRVKEQELHVMFQRSPPVLNDKGKIQLTMQYKAILSQASTVDIPDTDLCLTWVPNASSFADISKLLPVDTIKSGPCKYVYRTKDGEREDAFTTICAGRVGHAYTMFEGASFDLSIPTYSGQCMAAYISQSTGSHIAGFHLGGKPGTNFGVLGTISQKQYALALAELKAKPIVVVGPSEGTLKTEQFNCKFFETTSTHKKSPVNFLEGDTNIKVYGSISGRVAPRSSVITTVISDKVAEVTGVPQQWGPPHLWPEWKPYQESLKYAANPSIGIEGCLLEKAMQDYELPLVQLVRKNSYIKEWVRPLNEVETVAGIDGMRFIDKMPAKTSVGYPICKSKKDFLTLLDPEEYPEHSCPVELDRMFWEEAERCKQEYREGRRVYFIFNACTKDEPTRLDKDKVRIFQSAPLVAQLLIRMYYLPIARVLSIYPLKSECAVGINCQGPEWAQLQQHITKFGKDRILAGDYSKYDLRMPAQVMFCAFKILMNIARASGNYTEDDFTIMEGIATDVCYPMTAYNGTLLQLTGSNPSGQNLTVYINSIVNSLLFRCAYFNICKDRKSLQPFRDTCALATYGDDAKSSVHKDFPEFNHISVAKFMEDHDMKFTMPDKTSTPTEYMFDEECDFLKRKNIFCEEVGMPFGALDESSIFKSLHSTLRSSFLTPEEQAIQNVGGALREWFAHGREVYEQRRAQMKRVCDESNISVPDNDISYDERLMTWKQKYLSQQE